MFKLDKGKTQASINHSVCQYAPELFDMVQQSLKGIELEGKNKKLQDCVKATKAFLNIKLFIHAYCI